MAAATVPCHKFFPLDPGIQNAWSDDYPAHIYLSSEASFTSPYRLICLHLFYHFQYDKKPYFHRETGFSIVFDKIILPPELPLQEQELLPVLSYSD